MYLYGVCEEAAAAPAGEGIDARPLRMVTCAGLGAIVSDGHERPPEPSERELWEYERVVEELMSLRNVLPARFGSVVESDTDIRALLSGRNEELRISLRWVADAVELAVRATWSAETSVDETRSDDDTGTRYLARRVELRQRCSALCERIDRRLGELARDSTLRVGPSERSPMIGAYLVARDRVAEFRARIDELDHEIEEVAILCTGPWPPYSFVDPKDRGRD